MADHSQRYEKSVRSVERIQARWKSILSHPIAFATPPRLVFILWPARLLWGACHRIPCSDAIDKTNSAPPDPVTRLSHTQFRAPLLNNPKPVRERGFRVVESQPAIPLLQSGKPTGGLEFQGCAPGVQTDHLKLERGHSSQRCPNDRRCSRCLTGWSRLNHGVLRRILFKTPGKCHFVSARWQEGRL